MRKELIAKAYKMGYEAFPRFKCMPYHNPDFKAILRNNCKLNMEMHKQYIKGWVRAFFEFVMKEE